MIYRTIAISTMLALSAFADGIGNEPQHYSHTTASTVCPPSFTQDSITVSSTCPGLFTNVIVAPGTNGIVAANDNPITDGINSANPLGTGDADYNDIWLRYSIAAGPVGTVGDSITLTYGGAISAWTNHLILDGVTVDAAHPAATISDLTPWSTLTFFELTGGGGGLYSSVSADNVDGLHYFWISQGSDTPEVATMGMIGAGLLLLAGMRRRCRAEA